MKLLLQTGPNSFQTEDLQIMYQLSGTFKLDGFDNELKIESNVCYIDNTSIHISRFVGEIGGSYWLSSIAIMLYMQNHKYLFENKNVLEMGSGIGFAGIYVKRCCKPIEVTFSDVNPDICWESLKNNGIEAKSINIDWNEDIYCTDRYDILIAADCIYRNTQKSFVNAVRQLIKPGGILLMFNPVRDGVDDCIYALENEGDVDYFERKLLYKEYETTIVCTKTTFD